MADQYANEAQEMVRQFHRAMGQEAPDQPTLEGYPFELRITLLLEEVLEFTKACGYKPFACIGDGMFEDEVTWDSIRLEQGPPPDWADMIDDLCDILYVTYGAFVAMGVDAAPFFEAVQKSNMAKLWEDGKPRVREDGKILKSSNWVPPDIEGVLKRYLEEKAVMTSNESGGLA